MKLKTLIYLFTLTLVFFFGIFIFSALSSARETLARNQLNLYKVMQLHELSQTFQSSLLTHRLKKFSLISPLITRQRINDAEEELRNNTRLLIRPPDEEDGNLLEEKTRDLFDKAATVVYQLIRNDNLEMSVAGQGMREQLNINSAIYIDELNKLYYLYAYDSIITDSHSYLFIESVRVNNRLTLTLTELVDQIVDIKRNTGDKKQAYLKAMELIGVLDSLRARLQFIISTEPASRGNNDLIDQLIALLSKDSILKFAYFLTDSMEEPDNSALDKYYGYSLTLSQLSNALTEYSFDQELTNLRQKIYDGQVKLYGTIALSWLLALFIILPVLIFASKLTAWLTLINRNILKLSRGDLEIQPDGKMLSGELQAISQAINALRLEQIEKRRLESEKQALIEELLNASYLDPLTDLYNRRKFFSECSHIPADHYPLMFCLIDIDNFKQLNDRYGHDTGDQALIAFSQLLAAELEQDTIYCRYGGEEFALITACADPQQALAYIDRLRSRTETLRIGTSRGTDVGFTISCGIAGVTRYASINMAIKQADEALYFSKKSGKNQVSYYQRDGFIFSRHSHALSSAG